MQAEIPVLVANLPEMEKLVKQYQVGEIIENHTPKHIASKIKSMLANNPQIAIWKANCKNAAQELLQGKYPKTVNELAINGNDIMKRGLQGKAIGDMQKAMLIRIYADNVRNDREELLSLVSEKGNEVQEGYPEYSQMKPFTWNVNGEEVDVNFFVDKYDKWNNQGGKDSGYQEVSKESVLEFLQNNYEDFSVDEKLKREIYWKLIDRY
jgi:hypothetical protein